MRSVEIITEGLSDILYHSTSLNALRDILEHDRLRLTPDLGTGSDAEHRRANQFYYFSTSRSKMGDFHYPSSKYESGKTVLVLDGRRLMQDGFTGGPVDYWGAMIPKDEMEDRIFSTRPYIEDAHRYIRSAHVLFYKDQLDQDRRDHFQKLLRVSVKMGRKLNIPVYVYDDPGAFNALDTRRASTSIPLTRVERKSRLPDTRDPYGDPLVHRQWSWRRTPFGVWMELLLKPTEGELSDFAKKKLHDSLGWYREDQIRQLSADIHNAKSDTRNRPALDRFLGELQKRKINTVEGYFDYLERKYHDAI